MTKFRYILLALGFFTLSACTLQLNRPNSNTDAPKTEKPIANAGPKAEATPTLAPGTPLPEKSEKADNVSCAAVRRDGLQIDKKQTFAIDFPPFENSCFVTFHDPAFDNPPLGSQFFIYRNGQEIFNFPEQFGGGNTTCWVDAVAFEDVNDDQLKDIIVVGKCGAKSGSYNENMVYLNNGTEFTTNAEANAETLDFSKVGQIRDFIRKNPKLFIP
jgi:hypothetical protein